MKEGLCVEECGEGYYLNMVGVYGKECNRCYEGCKICIGPQTYDCANIDDTVPIGGKSPTIDTTYVASDMLDDKFT